MPTTRVCYECNVLSHQTRDGKIRIVAMGDHGVAGTFHRLWAAFTCDNCRAPSVGIVLAYDRGILSESRAEELFRVDGDVRFQPERATGKNFPDVPTEIANAADEAYRCASVQAYRGALILGRAVMEATAKEKGISTGVLQVKIEAMAKQGLIREHIKEAAHEIRDLGNDMAHGDFGTAVTKEDVDLILSLMDDVLLEVFQSRARVQRAQDARAAKAAAAKGP